MVSTAKNPISLFAGNSRQKLVMFKADHADEPFIFGWLKKPYAEALDGEEISNTELRIRILKLILLVNPNAVLNIKITTQEFSIIERIS